MSFRRCLTTRNILKAFSPQPSATKYKPEMGRYEDAIIALNGLQSNIAYIRSRSYQNSSYEDDYNRTIDYTRKLLLKVGISSDDLNKLSVIHVAGTKGKGSTCAYCESILRHHGYKTGFYSSPHLLEVRERIRINGKPISYDMFAEYFWNVYNTLKSPENKPLEYFRFLTIMALKVFLREKVDVAIIEVGIGGEFDNTNIIEKVPTVGITSLGIDHTSLLGETIDKIAWHKAGIMKNNSRVYTVAQPIEAMQVLMDRAKEKKAQLYVTEPFLNIAQQNRAYPDVININASLGCVLAHSWMENVKGIKVPLDDFVKMSATQEGLSQFSWPGRYQIFQHGKNNYYLDGAHTPESISICLKWFQTKTKKSSRRKALFFNMIGQRDAERMLSMLVKYDFETVFFVPNISGFHNSADNKITDSSYYSDKCVQHKNIWIQLLEKNSRKVREEEVLVLTSVYEAVKCLNGKNFDCLVTGSLHLMGAILEILDPELSHC